MIHKYRNSLFIIIFIHENVSPTTISSWQNVSNTCHDAVDESKTKNGLTLTHRKDQMNDHMECHESNENPIKPAGQFGFCQFYSKENCYNWKYLREEKYHNEQNNWLREKLISYWNWERRSNLLARMWAALPPNQWSQLNMGRLLDVGDGRNSAPNGCKKHMAVVIVPRIACGLSSADQSPNSTKINTNAAIVSAHVKIINIRCHWKIFNNYNLNYCCCECKCVQVR